MFEELTCGCAGCDRELDDQSRQLTYRTGGVERRAYECPCGKVTVTVAR